jgi:hypothetical protein
LRLGHFQTGVITVHRQRHENNVQAFAVATRTRIPMKQLLVIELHFLQANAQFNWAVDPQF